MITKLTKEQERLMPEFIEKWTRIGLSTEPADRPRAETAIKWMYQTANLSEPKILWCGGPLSSSVAFASMRTRCVCSDLIDITRNSAAMLISPKVSQIAWDNVFQSLSFNVTRRIMHQICIPIRFSVLQTIGDSIVLSNTYRLNGQHEAGYLSFYDFFKMIGFSTETASLYGEMEMAESVGCYIPMDGLCILGERHSTLRVNAQFSLHCDGGPAVEYPDGFQVHALNGVQVSKDYAETPAERLDPRKVITESNAEVRRELIRKVGIERLLSVLPTTVIDTRGTYELLRIKLSDAVPNAIYLKMVNPSVGFFHVEGVDPSCKSVQEAINWRADQPDWSPEIVT